jgi:hypothetical protein
MYRNSDGSSRGFSRPIELTSAEARLVAGGSVHKNDNSGPGSAPYNTPGNPDYGHTPGGSDTTTTRE